VSNDSESHQSGPRFRKGLDGLKRTLEEDEINLAHDLIAIRHHLQHADWPSSATEFVERALSYFPDAEEDNEDWPDWSASEVLAFVLHDLAQALERRPEQPE
jgi:hypothetical protein